MKALKNEKGFSLLDATLSIMMLATGLTGGLFLMQNATRASVRMDYHVIATELAREKLEIIVADKAMRSAKYDYVDEGNYPAEELDYMDQSGVFTRSVNVETVDPDTFSETSTDAGVKKIDVTVSWNDVTGAQSITVGTIVTKNEE